MQDYKLEDLFEYDMQNNALFVLKNKVRHRQVFPDENMNICVLADNIKIRMKYSILVWSVVHKRRLKPNEVIFHKDLDESNNCIYNLVVMTKKERFKIKEGLKNITGTLRLLPHPSDSYRYILEYRENGRLRRETFEDIVPAKKKLARMQVKIIKFLGKYVVSV